MHAIGLLFDVNSGLEFFNTFTSASKSVPDPESTYDNITRKTALLVIAALKSRMAMPAALGGKRVPIAFVSCAEAGWPDVQFGDVAERAAPEWLQRYLVAKRAVEAELNGATDKLRPIIIRCVTVEPKQIALQHACELTASRLHRPLASRTHSQAVFYLELAQARHPAGHPRVQHRECAWRALRRQGRARGGCGRVDRRRSDGRRGRRRAALLRDGAARRTPQVKRQ